MEPQVHPKYLPPTLQKHREYFLDEQSSFLNGLNVQNLSKDQKITVRVTGESKTGKSTTCNELIGFQLRVNSKSQRKGLFSSGSNQMTSFPTFYAYHENLSDMKKHEKENKPKICYQLIDNKKLMSSEILSGAKEVNFKALKQLEDLHKEQRSIIKQKDEEKQTRKRQFTQIFKQRKLVIKNQQYQTELSGTSKTLIPQLQKGIKICQDQQTKINEIQRINEELNQEINKSLLIQGPYLMLNGEGQKTLNKYVLICDTVGNNDQVKPQKDENQFENPFNCYIICFDLSSGFTKDCKQKLRKIYEICPNPNNVTISLNLANYLKPPFADNQNNVDSDDEEEDEQYIGFQNIDSFLQQFLYRIPDTLIKILNDQGTWSKIIRKAKRLKFWGKQKQINKFDQLKQKIKSFQNLLSDKGDQQKLILSIIKDKTIPNDLMQAYPFELIKFSGKIFTDGYEKDQIVKSVYEKADQVFKRKVKGNIQSSLSMMWEEKKQKNITKFSGIIERFQNKLQSQAIPKDKLKRLIGFQRDGIYPILKLIRDEFLKGFQQNRDQDLQTSKKLEEWIRQHEDRPQQRNWYLVSQTLKAEYQKQISGILNQNTNKTKEIYKNLAKAIEKSQNIKEKIININKMIEGQKDKVIKEQMKKMLKDNIEDVLGTTIQDLCARELQAHNDIITQIKQQAANESLELQLVDLNIPDIIKSTFLVLFGFLGPVLGITISIGRIILIAFTAVQAAIFSIPLAVSGVVYYPLKSYLSRKTDRSMIEKWQDYLIFFRTIENKMRRSSQRKTPTRNDSLFAKMERQQPNLEQKQSKFQKIQSEISNIQSFIQDLKTFLQNFKKECSKFEAEVLKDSSQ